MSAALTLEAPARPIPGLPISGRRTMVLMNRRVGDITLAWDPEDREKMLPMIEAKMKAGITFFIIEAPDRHLRMNRIGDLQTGINKVLIGDRDAELLFNDGAMGIVPAAESRQGEFTALGKRATTAAEVVENHTVEIPPPRGG